MSKYSDKVCTECNYVARQRELRNILPLCGKDCLISTAN